MRKIKYNQKDKKDKVESLKQQARELTKDGEIAKAIRLFNQAWMLEHGYIKEK